MNSKLRKLSHDPKAQPNIPMHVHIFKLDKITNINSHEFDGAESQETEKRSRAKQYLKQFGSHIPHGKSS